MPTLDCNQQAQIERAEQARKLCKEQLSRSEAGFLKGLQGI